MLDKVLFEPILDKDEEVIKMYAPDKRRAWFGTIVWVVFAMLCFVPSAILAFLAGKDALSSAILLTVFAVLSLVVPIIMIALWCNKTVYAVTNKRIIIRTGYIGVDYKSLDYNMLGAITVNVNVWDKILRRNTGTISFGGMSSPLTTQGVAKFVFMFVNKPYETNKEIKAIIDENRTNK